jgi:endonuclease/exonuclease/phosphatase family metal-dependent hydrolase
MKFLIYGLLLLLVSVNLSANTDSSAELSTTNEVTLMSYNIRCGFCEPEASPNHWSKRKFLITQLIKSHAPDLIGLQEAELFQVQDLAALLDGYEWVGVGRDDGKTRGESTAVLFRSERFSLQHEKTLWLSPTPEQPSKGWGADFPRTLSILHFIDLKTKSPLQVLNTHFDHNSELARQESAHFLLAQISKLPATEPLALVGDFNFVAPSESYTILSGKLSDAETISRTAPTGGHKTFNDFGKNIEEKNKIDFIFVNQFLEVLSHQIDVTTYDGNYPSDHYPIVVKLKIQLPPSKASKS